VHGTEGEPDPSPEVMQRMYAQVDTFNHEVMASGNWVFGGGLYPAATATVVDATRGDVVTTDGPFVESKEHLGGFWIFTADNLDEVLELARRASQACERPIEVRPFQDDTDA
jgi:hypothetical protein